MSEKAIPSRSTPEKWGCSQCDYGHDVGKSRNGVYKHYKSKHEDVDSKQARSVTVSNSVKKSKFSQKVEEKIQPRSASVLEEENFTESVQTDFVQNDEDENFTQSVEWGSVEWDESSSSDEVPKARTIPKPLSDMAQGKVSQMSMVAQGQVIRFGFMTLDRMLTHYGRGVTGDKEFAIERTKDDYDTLETSTVSLMEYYGISVPVSPLMVWSATVGSAYIPPLMYIRKNADPNRKGRFTGALKRLVPRRRRKKKGGEEDESRTNA